MKRDHDGVEEYGGSKHQTAQTIPYLAFHENLSAIKPFRPPLSPSPRSYDCRPYSSAERYAPQTSLS